MNWDLRKIIERLLLSFLLLGMVFPIDAQENPRNGLSLSLEEALKMAFSSYEKVKISQSQVEEARGELWQSYSRALPSFDANYRYRRNVKKPTLFLETGTIPLGFDNEHNLQINALQPLTHFGGIYYNILSAKQAKDAQVYAYKQNHADVAYEVKRAYFNVLLEQAHYLVAKADFEQSEEIAKREAIRLKVGEIAEFDYNRSALEVENKRADLTQSEGNLQIVQQKLKRLLNLTEDQEINLSDSIAKFALPVDENEAQNTFATANPAVQSLQKTADSADSARKAARADFFPRFYFFGNYDFTGQSSEHFFPQGQEVTHSISMGLNVDIPLFDGMLTAGRYKTAAARARTASYEKELQSKDLKLSLEQAFIEAKTQSQRVQNEKKSLELAETLYRQAQIKLQQGTISFIDLKDVGDQLEAARLRYVNSLYTYALSRAKIEQIVGVESLP